MIGPILIITGLYWLWVVWHGKAGPMWNAITGNSGFSTSLDDVANAVNPYINGTTGKGSSGTAPVTGNTNDSGTHMGIDSSGNIITINKSYANMTPSEKDAANNYAHQIGNIG